ncbi:ferrichrome ABC transporter permease [Paenibacillus baekrokdamisoli]|uniref:Ferrichrome ABC transporter permease n=1 Tax=Paenibacillus baekrokdamisoli TaxID=1712516 RepID=A0A3G9J353_9BACL|nr:iron ABC transporter permease [Paenibacillus baekrokdamisoli]MBB3069424.1 iron complex transport system permease protein [Paenibacillus baekrokdamisoli]BBH25002.1 ferrichrome ABC transporter permease [Paenibacillus baekrokdamisoli]
MSEKVKKRTRPLTGAFLIIGGMIALVFSLALSISVGAADISLSTVWGSVLHFNPDLQSHQIIRELRMPRALASAMVGACFAVAGAIMQGMTRNPLADSGLLGINAGSGVVLAICFAFFPGLPYLHLILYSFLGAGLGAGLVFGIGALAKNGLTPVRLALAGAAVGTLLVAISEGIAIYANVGQDLAFWFAGGVAGTKWLQLKLMLPFILAALAAAIVLSRSVTLLSLGDEIAAGLGQRTALVKVACTIVVLILAGTSVSAVGPIGFIGLIIPHLVRYLVGVDYRWIIPCSAIVGALFVVFADIGARLINAPAETPIGLLIALIGVPFFLYLARNVRREL